MAEAPVVPAEEDEEAIHEVHGEDEIVTTFLHRLVCQLCDKIFEEDVLIACVHLTFCWSCLEENGLHDYVKDGMVCTQCSKISVSRTHQSNSQQDILNSMHLRAQCRRGLLKSYDNPAVKLLCQKLQEALNITGSTSANSPSLPGSSQPTNVGGTTPCLRSKCKTCNLVVNLSTVTGPNGHTMNVEKIFKCSTKFVIYYIKCKICTKPYVGQTKQALSARMSQHCRDIQNNDSKSSVAKHFNDTSHRKDSKEQIKDFAMYFEVCVIKSFHYKISVKKMEEEEKKIMIHLGTIEPNGMNES